MERITAPFLSAKSKLFLTISNLSTYQKHKFQLTSCSTLEKQNTEKAQEDKPRSPEVMLQGYCYHVHLDGSM